MFYDSKQLGINLETIRSKVFKAQQKEVADVLGMSRSNLSSIENGRVMPTLEVLLLYCLTCQTPLDTLLIQNKFNKFVEQAPQNLTDNWLSIMTNIKEKESIKLKLIVLTRHLKYAREQIRMITQKEFAERLGVSQSNISDIEKGKVIPSLQTLIDMALALEITLNNLVSTVSIESENELRLSKEWETPLFQLEVNQSWKDNDQISVKGLTSRQCVIVKNLIEEFRTAHNTPEDAADMIVIQPENTNNNDREKREYCLSVFKRSW